MKIRKFHLYLADLSPRMGTEAGKIRPVIVIQTNMLNNINHPSTIICPLTTRILKEANLLRVYLDQKISNIKKDSDILIDQIRSIDNRRFIKHLGEISEKQKKLLLENLEILIQQ